MIKKISIISLLIITLLLSSSFEKLNEAEAGPITHTLYVALTKVGAVSVGLYMYMFGSGGATEKLTVESVDIVTGQITFRDYDSQIDDSSNTHVHSSIGGVPLYDIPKDYISCAENPGFLDSDTDQIFGADPELLASDYADSRVALGEPVLYVTYAVFVAGTVHIDMCSYGPDPNSEFPDPVMTYDSNPDGLGFLYNTDIDGTDVNFYEFLEDVPVYPDCFDGIQNQDETGVDCGGVCLLNFGFDCTAWEKCFNGVQDQDETGIDCGGYCLTALGISCDQGTGPETCFDKIMNQDETGIDYGGVCGTGDSVSTPSVTFIDENGDGIDDISGLANDGTIPAPMPSVPDSGTYDPSLPGDISEVGETGWSDLILGYLSINPLVLLATDNDITLVDSSCTLTANVFDNDFTIDFCSVEGMIDLIGTFVLGLMAIRSVFIALGI